MRTLSLPVKRLLPYVVLLVCFPSVLFAHNKVVVIPMGADEAEPPANIIVVAKENGHFTNPSSAVNSIDDASINKRYLVFIAPGVYTLGQSMVMRPYVDVVGSGQNMTKLVGNISSGVPDSTSSMIVGSNNAHLKSLSIENLGGSGFSIGIYNDNASPNIDDVSVTVTGASVINYGVLNIGGSEPRMSNGSVKSKSSLTVGNKVYPLVCIGSGGTYTNLSILADGSDQNLSPKASKAIGVLLSGCQSVVLDGGSVLAIDGVTTNAIFTSGNTFVKIAYNRSLFSSATVVRAEDTSIVNITRSNFSEPGVSTSGTATISCLLSTIADTIEVDQNCSPP